MKKFMKRCAILAFIFAVLGCVLGMVGSTIAGRSSISQMLEDISGGRIHAGEGWRNWHMEMGSDFLEDIGDALDDVDYDIQDASTFDREFEVMTGNVERYCPGQNIRNLEVEVGGCQLETKISEDDSIYLEAEHAHKFQGYVSGDTLYVRATTGSVKDFAEVSKRRIILYVPQDYFFEQVKIEVGAGELSFADLHAESANLEVGAGRIVLDGVQAQDLELSVGAGSIELFDMSIAKLEAEVGLGEFRAEGSIESEADVQCSMGNVEMTLDDREEAFNYHLEGSMGNISLGSESYSGFSSERKIDNHADKEMEIECSMGNISIDFRK